MFSLHPFHRCRNRPPRSTYFSLRRPPLAPRAAMFRPSSKATMAPRTARVVAVAWITTLRHRACLPWAAWAPAPTAPTPHPPPSSLHPRHPPQIRSIGHNMPTRAGVWSMHPSASPRSSIWVLVSVCRLHTTLVCPRLCRVCPSVLGALARAL
jgi:hypothetical protein